MKILAFDTAMAACSAAVTEHHGGRSQVLAAHREARTRGHAETLVPLIGRIMADAGVSFADLDRIAVTIGPGTFTGVRIGVATARGLAVASGLPVTGVSTLEAVAAGLAQGAQTRPIASVFDARRGEVYVQIFSPALDPLTEPQALSYRAAGDLIARHRPALVGTGVHLVQTVEEGAETLLQVADDPAQPSAVLVAERAATRGITHIPPAPLYLRPPDAKLPK